MKAKAGHGSTKAEKRKLRQAKRRQKRTEREERIISVLAPLRTVLTKDNYLEFWGQTIEKFKLDKDKAVFTVKYQVLLKELGIKPRPNELIFSYKRSKGPVFRCPGPRFASSSAYQSNTEGTKLFFYSSKY